MELGATGGHGLAGWVLLSHYGGAISAVAPRARTCGSLSKAFCFAASSCCFRTDTLPASPPFPIALNGKGYGSGFVWPRGCRRAPQSWVGRQRRVGRWKAVEVAENFGSRRAGEAAPAGEQPPTPTASPWTAANAAAAAPPRQAPGGATSVAAIIQARTSFRAANHHAAPTTKEPAGCLVRRGGGCGARRAAATHPPASCSSSSSPLFARLPFSSRVTLPPPPSLASPPTDSNRPA